MILRQRTAARVAAHAAAARSVRHTRGVVLSQARVDRKGGDGGGGGDEDGQAADGCGDAEKLGERKPGVKYDYWGRPIT